MADQTIDEEQEGELLLPVEPKPDSGKRIAIVGGGPAGLAAAFYARLEGHAVKIFEALPKPGGMLRYGIPSYRLPRDLLDKEINVLWRMGVEIQVNSRLGVDYQLEDLFDEGFDAVFLALGAFNSNDMGIPGEDAEGVVTAVDFLGDLELNGEVHVGNKVTVIGGGFTAMDACRTAVRHGAKEVTCLYRRSRKEMPAHHTEVDEAEEEGVRFVLQVAPVRVLTDDAGKVPGIEMIRMELGEPDASGRRRPVPLEGSEFVVECDQVISAIGQFPKLDGAGEAEGLAHTRWRTLAVDDWTLQTADPKVFAGGDAVLGAQTVIQAVAQGKKAAWSMDAYLRGADMQAVSQQLHDLRRTPFLEALTAKGDMDKNVRRLGEVPPVFIDINTGIVEVSPPARMPKLWPEDRKTNFDQIELGFPEDEAVRGAELCLQCTCEAHGDCDLQRHGIEYEVFANRFQGTEARDYEAYDDQPLIAYDPKRCILCGKCVGVCREVQVTEAINFTRARLRGRSSRPRSAAPWSTPRSAEICGKCVDVCPTGALTNRQLNTAHLGPQAGAHHLPVLRRGLQHRPAGQGRARRPGDVAGRGRRRRGQPVRQGPLRLRLHPPPRPPHHPADPPRRRARPGHLGRGARPRRRERLAAIKAEHGPDAVGGFWRGALHERGELPLPEVHAYGGRDAQRRPLRPPLPQLHRDRSGRGVRQRRDDQLDRRPGTGAGHPRHRQQHHRGAPHHRHRA